MACCAQTSCSSNAATTGRFRAVLWIVLVINAVMFLVEIAAGLAAGSVALQADALDFLADAANYGISLFVLGLSLAWRARAALVKGASMGLFGLWVVGNLIWHVIHGTVPAWGTMGAVGAVALMANAACLALLYAWREGDSNMRSVWICSRNDVIANIGVLAAAAGVFGSGTDRVAGYRRRRDHVRTGVAGRRGRRPQRHGGALRSDPRADDPREWVCPLIARVSRS